MNIKLKNVVKKEKNNLIEFKPKKINKNTYSIHISSDKNIFVQMKLYTKFIEHINIIYGDRDINITSNNYLLAGKLGDDTIKIVFKPFDYCSRIILKNINITYNLVLSNILWDNIYIINLVRRTERKNEMIAQLEKQNITQYEFIDAYDGQNNNTIEEYNKIKENNSLIVTSGHYACLLSHIKAIKKAKENNYNNIMILEDDILFCDNFFSIINSIKIPCYDMIYLGGIIDKKKLFLNNWSQTTKIMGAYAYILNISIYDTILDLLEKKNNYVDLIYLNYIQSNYRVYLLDDIIKTNLLTSDTSAKSKKIIKRLDIININ